MSGSEGPSMIVALAIGITVLSVIAASLYVIDKRRSRDHEERISERTLLFWSLIGGWPGAWLAGRILRHKTQKVSYRIKFTLCLLVHLGACFAFLRWFSGSFFGSFFGE